MIIRLFSQSADTLSIFGLTCVYNDPGVCPAVVFVIDSCHRDRLMEAHSELAKLLTEKELRDALLLIFANKQVLWS